MAAIFSKFDLSCEEKLFLSTAISKHTTFSDGCAVWNGLSAHDGYGLLRVMFRNKRLKVKVHRMAYFLGKCVALNSRMHVSHTCHNKLCVSVDHLSYEPQRINNNRMVCKNTGECCGHYPYARCPL